MFTPAFGVHESYKNPSIPDSYWRSVGSGETHWESPKMAQRIVGASSHLVSGFVKQPVK